MPVSPLVSVVIITRDRPTEMLRQTLMALGRQMTAPLETLVVDTSAADALPWMITNEFPLVRVMHIPDGPRCMPWSRNQGIAETKGEIIAFLDDDALAEPQWLAEIVRAYGDDPSIGGVGGRVIEGLNLGGTVRNSGDPVAFFDKYGLPHADFNSITDDIIEVGHLKGCNMSFRRTALAAVDGFDEYYSGIAHREETDLCIRVRRSGYRLLYNPQATVEHKTYSLYTDRRMVLERVGSGFPGARLDGYYIAKNFGARAWVRWYVRSNAYALARAIKATCMAFTRALFSVGGGVAGLASALRPSPSAPNVEEPVPSSLTKCEVVSPSEGTAGLHHNPRKN